MFSCFSFYQKINSSNSIYFNKHYFCRNISLLKQVRFILLFLIIGISVFAQKDTLVKSRINNTKEKIADDSQVIKISSDTLKYVDSLTNATKDSLQKDSIQRSLAKELIVRHSDTSSYSAIIFNAYFPFDKKPEMMIEQKRISSSNDVLFYVLVGLVLIVGFVRVTFSKYFSSLFELFFQTSFRQHQTRDQLLQDKLPSLIMNIVFVFSGGMLITLMAKFQGWITFDFWWLYLYSCVLLAVIYLIKYLFLLFFGWVFNASSAVNTYIFVIFLVNKIMAILFIPLILFLAYSSTKIANISLTIAEIMIAIFLIYRYVASLGTIRRSLHVNALHFFLYICAAEVLPLLIIYKVLFNYIQGV